MEYFTKEERLILIEHMKELLINVNNGDITIDETMETMKGILYSVNTLKKKRGL